MLPPSPGNNTHQSAWTYWNDKLASPRFIMAPMVNQSDLPFRLLARRYGTHLCYTPMLHSRLFATDAAYRASMFEHPPINKQDRPLVAQLCGHDPATVVAAGRLLEKDVDAIDLNCGCPQGIARKGQYGAFLLSKPDLIIEIVSAMVSNLKVPIFVKLRLMDENNVAPTVALCQKLQDVGVFAICVHGRTIKQKGHDVGPADWDAVRCIRESLGIPVICNGGIRNKDDAERCIAYTGCAAVMSAEGLLENPSAFSEDLRDVDDLMSELIALYMQYPSSNCAALKAHLFHALYPGLQRYVDLRDQLAKGKALEDYKAVVVEMKARRQGESISSKQGWYLRHRQIGSKGQNSTSNAEGKTAEEALCKKRRLK